MFIQVHLGSEQEKTLFWQHFPPNTHLPKGRRSTWRPTQVVLWGYWGSLSSAYSQVTTGPQASVMQHSCMILSSTTNCSSFPEQPLGKAKAAVLGETPTAVLPFGAWPSTSTARVLPWYWAFHQLCLTTTVPAITAVPGFESPYCWPHFETRKHS